MIDYIRSAIVSPFNYIYLKFSEIIIPYNFLHFSFILIRTFFNSYNERRVMFMTEQIKNMNKQELIDTFKTLETIQEDLRQIYEKEFGDRVGEEITNNIDIQLFERIKNDLNVIVLAKHYISDRLSSEFNIFVM